MSKRVVILGAGPIGVEAALLAALRGHDVQLFERGQAGAHVASWGHVTLFSPWSLNRSAWGAAALTALGHKLDPGEDFPTGAQYLERYLLPLTHHPLIEGRLHTQTEVLGVARAGALKSERVGARDAGAGPLWVMVRDALGERYVPADVVLDATGTLAQPLHIGPGGLPALGELAHSARITRYVPDLDAAPHQALSGQHVLLIGGGHSAVTTLKQLHAAHRPGGAITWVLRGSEQPYTIMDEDPLPQRLALARFGNAAAAGDLAPLIRPIPHAHVLRIADGDGGALDVTLLGEDGREQRVRGVDHIVANVGYRPDLSLTRELQIHHCYASEGPMKLAASLLAAGGGGGDCLAQTSGGVETLRNPERDVFILGAKSYGRGSSFLLKIGFEQLEAVMETI